MWKRRNRAADEEALLIEVRVQNMHEVADHMEPEAFTALWRCVVDTTERHVSRRGAALVEVHISDPDGARILCMRSAADPMSRLAVWSTDLLRALQESLGATSLRTPASVSLCAGSCIPVRLHDGTTRVLGGAASRVSQLSLAAPQESDAVLIDPSVAPAFECTQLRTVRLADGRSAQVLDMLCPRVDP